MGSLFLYKSKFTNKISSFAIQYLSMTIDKLSSYITTLDEQEPLIIAGPCSAESPKQILDTALQISNRTKTHIYRAGIWKPRTRPGNFEGVGENGLQWLSEVKKQTGLLLATEVANPEHINMALKHKVDILWIGARTVANPFSIQEIADSLKGVNIPVFIKNPINPDLGLWIGAIERIRKAGTSKIAAIHRGFYPYEETKFRNIPKWEIPIELKRQFHQLPIICDPSHISGTTDYIHEVSQKALDLNFNGLMIETHNNPTVALSDSEQQLTPSQLEELLQQLTIRNALINKSDQTLQQYREQIDSIDQQMLELLSQRMTVIRKIGDYKLGNNISIFQLRRWENILKTRLELGQSLNLDTDFIKEILQLMHKASIQVQNQIMNKE